MLREGWNSRALWVVNKTDLEWISLRTDTASGRKGQSFSHISPVSAQRLLEGPRADSLRHSSPLEPTRRPWKISKRSGLNLPFLPGECKVQHDCMCVCNERLKKKKCGYWTVTELSSFSEGHLSFSTCARLWHFHLQARAALKSGVRPWIGMMDSDGTARGRIDCMERSFRPNDTAQHGDKN